MLRGAQLTCLSVASSPASSKDALDMVQAPRRDMVQPGPPPLGGWGATVIVLVSMQRVLMKWGGASEG